LFGFAAPAFINAAPQGFLEGQLKIISASPVALDDENPSRLIDAKPAATGADYAKLSPGHSKPGEKKQVARITADAAGDITALRFRQGITSLMQKDGCAGACK